MTVNASNVITAVTMSGTSKFKQIVSTKNGIKWESKPSIDAEAGTLSYEQTASIKNAGLSTQSANLLTEIGLNNVVLIFPHRNNTWWMLGGGYIGSVTTGGGLQLSNETVMTPGENPKSYAGVTFAFEGSEYYNAREIQSSVVTSIIG